VPSMGSVGDCFDNVLSESSNATLAKELLRWNTYRTVGTPGSCVELSRSSNA
jgi:hypothetical protein